MPALRYRYLFFRRSSPRARAREGVLPESEDVTHFHQHTANDMLNILYADIPLSKLQIFQQLLSIVANVPINCRSSRNLLHYERVYATTPIMLLPINVAHFSHRCIGHANSTIAFYFPETHFQNSLSNLSLLLIDLATYLHRHHILQISYVVSPIATFGLLYLDAELFQADNSLHLHSTVTYIFRGMSSYVWHGDSARQSLTHHVAADALYRNASMLSSL
ncbi:hypothetical protein HGRIS_003537 [Hohenbuehelia grisea]|uniref:Uncharacterized protein n=1 Tax=Hohenbuehelia grisea TaxID=104357 RepID=A0ABR3JGC6_9AGAR